MRKTYIVEKTLTEVLERTGLDNSRYAEVFTHAFSDGTECLAMGIGGFEELSYFLTGLEAVATDEGIDVRCLDDIAMHRVGKTWVALFPNVEVSK